VDLNIVLIAIVSLASALTLLRGLAAPTAYNRGWRIVATLTLAVLLLSLFVRPEMAGFIGGGVWGVLVLLPSLGFRLVNQFVLQQQYGQARRLAVILRWLHPADGWFEQPEFLKALELGQQGHFGEAGQILQKYQATDTAASQWATIQLYRMNGQWEELQSWFEQHLQHQGVQRASNNLILYLRALGETGNLNGLLEAYKQYEPKIETIGSSTPLAHLFLFAFAGRPALVSALLQNSLKTLPADVKKFWLATAHLSANQEAEGRRLLADILDSDDILLRIAAKRRQAHPLPVAETVLTPDNRATLAQAEIELDHAERFGHVTGPGRTTAYITYGLIGLNLIAFGLEVLLGGSQNIRTLYQLGGLVTEAAIAGEWWRLLASMFLHYGPVHLGLNMFGLYILGPFVEFALGRRRYLLIYLVSGLGAALTVLLTSFLILSNNQQLLVGASGAIMGLVGATGAILWRGWRIEKSRIASRRLVIIVAIVVLQVVFDLMTPQVSFTAHLAGFITGFAATGLLKHRISKVNGVSNG
jgi:rhomboid protease GluP